MTMYPPERQRAITDLLIQHDGRRASVLQISEQLRVTTETVRRDLDVLERRGAVRAEEVVDLWESKMDDRMQAVEKKDRFLERRDRIIGRHSGADREGFVRKLREGERLIAEGKHLGEVAKALEVSDCTYLRWRNQYGGLKADDAKELRRLKDENGRLKRVVADLTLDNASLREAARGNS
jgi:DNA-binding Lrp family transcriptional regulator